MLQRIPMDEFIERDRRKESQPVDVDRRTLSERDMHTRVSVLEVKVSNASDRLEESYATQTKIIERLDQHTQQSAVRDHQLQVTMAQITVAVTNLSESVTSTNDTLKTIATMASDSHNELMKWNTIASTLVKVASVAAIIIGAAWTVFTWVEKQHGDKVALTDIPAHISQDVAKANTIPSELQPK